LNTYEFISNHIWAEFRSKVLDVTKEDTQEYEKVRWAGLENGLVYYLLQIWVFSGQVPQAGFFFGIGGEKLLLI
jgi:hypothetical protein